MFYIETETLRYFFSSIAQSMAALFAVGGIFAIYRFQYIESQLSSAIKSFRAFYHRTVSYDVFLPNGLGEHNRGYIEEQYRKAKKDAEEANEWLDKDIPSILLYEFKINPNNKGILDYCYYFLKIIEAKTVITKQMKCPMVLILLNFLLSIYFLIMIDSLCTYFLAFLALGLSVLSTITFIKLFLYIKLCFSLPKSLEFNNKFIGEDSLAELRKSATNKIKDIIKTYSESEFKRLKIEMENFLKNKN